MWTVGLFWIAGGILAFYSGFFNWNPDSIWFGTAFWDALIGRKWANRLSMLFGVIAIAGGIMVVIYDFTR